MSPGIGPQEGDLTVEELEVAWQVERDRLMRCPRAGQGQCPWAFWRFEVGEEPPEDPWHDEPVRLAELVLVAAEELADFQERANVARLRIGTVAERHYWPKGSGSVCRDVAAVWEAIQAVRR